MSYYNGPKKESLEAIANDWLLTPNQKETEVILFSAEFTDDQVRGMFRLLRAMVDNIDGIKHVGFSPYQRFLLECAEDIVLDARRSMQLENSPVS